MLAPKIMGQTVVAKEGLGHSKAPLMGGRRVAVERL
jgi:hypothetical protein